MAWHCCRLCDIEALVEPTTRKHTHTHMVACQSFVVVVVVVV
jgi:hypothetical protein